MEAMSRTVVLDPTRVQEARSRGALAVVGIGASAGGLRALQEFFGMVPADSGMAYVVITHLDPHRESRLDALLQDRTPVPVTQVTGTTTVEANHIYLIPPGQDLRMENAAIHMQERSDDRQHSPIDLFFRTLAAAFGPDAVGVVLSGTGRDGAAGIRHIKEGGGITVAQSPEEAEYDGMPASAIATGQIDRVLPAAGIPLELIRLRRPPSPLPLDTLPEDTEVQLAEIFALLRVRTGHDFSLYKRSTVLRRLERRLRLGGAATLEDYLPVLRAGEAEVRALLRDLLISVSSFFRDPEAFAALAEAIPALFEGKGPRDAVRVWVVGCATGEEAYSIGILLHEHAATLADPPKIQIFATDIDEKGYAWGREALYPSSVAAEIPPERLRRHFTPESGGYRITRPLREGVLFAVHNVLQDPPFSRLDLISCRNLLIYLQPEAQERAIGTFHYALRPQGLLFLGSAESAGDRGRFVPVAATHRVYRRDDTQNRALPRLSAADPPPLPAGPPARPADGHRPHRFAYGALHLRMLERYASASLVVNERMEVVHLSGRAGGYLHMGGGEPSHNLMDLVGGELRTEIRSALDEAFEKRLPTTRRLRLDGDDGAWVDLRVHPGTEDDGEDRFALVVFDEQALAEPARADAPGTPAGPAGRRTVTEREDELRRTREQLVSISSARHRTVENLEYANQELLSINEEQKAAAQELETSREEIQSINEELITINQEHQSTIEELKRTNTDLQNLIESTGIGTVFLDRSLRIRRFTPAAGALFNFVATDRGRPLAHITHRLDYPGLVADAQNVLTSQDLIEREASSEPGEWYIVRINPYRSAEGEIDGVVLTFFDNTVQKRAREELREAKAIAESASLVKGSFLATMSHEFRTPLNAMLGYSQLLDLDGPLTTGQLEKLERIQVCGRQIGSMIEEILTFAKLDEGRETARFERIDARAIAREAIVVVEPAAKAKDLALVLTVPDQAVELDTDADKVCRILVNLCGNAIKYTERGEVRIEVRAEEERVVFEVRDTGIGITQVDQPHVFERFWRSDNATTRSSGGMGIGLAAAREFARLMGGDIHVQSDLGRGSTFHVQLPRRQA
jgi:two-component system, chemotaxis family, CheB/CheR fusion protein